MLRGSGLSSAQVKAVAIAGYGVDANQVFSTVSLNGASAGAATVADTLYLYPFSWYGGRPIANLFGRVTTIGVASNIKFALWANNPTTGRPTGVPLLGNNTAIPTTGAGIVSASVGPLDPPAGVVWVGSVQDGTTAGMQAVSPANFDTVLFPADFQVALLRGAANNGLHGISTPLTLASNILAADLTSAVFTMVGGNAALIPIVDIGF